MELVESHSLQLNTTFERGEAGRSFQAVTHPPPGRRACQPHTAEHKGKECRLYIILGAWHCAWFLWVFCKLTIPSLGEVFYLPDYWQVRVIYCALAFVFVLFLEKVSTLSAKVCACTASLNFKMLYF